jgi:pilus assembly protein Flp/PilA
MRTLRTWIRARGLAEVRKRGAALTEYGIMLALIATVLIGIITTLGSHIRDVLQSIVNQLGGGDA